MTKKFINKLVSASYKKDELDSESVKKIASLLSRRDLKAYIRSLKLSEKARAISLVLPMKSVYNKTTFEALFQGKQITVSEDPSLLLGLKIIDNDMVYDMTLKDRLENFVQELQ
jgi:F0F1-type ATP synthase delta subunit